jgi:hypothetical protein
MKVYKVLKFNLVSPFESMQYELGKEYVCDNFDDDVTNDCSRGLYATPTIEGCLYANLANGKVVVECEGAGKCVDFDRFKIRWEKLTPVRVLSEEEIRALARRESAVRGYNIEEALFPIDPFKIKPPEITDEHISLLKNWVPVRDSVREPEKHSVWEVVVDLVGPSVSVSVRDLVGDLAYCLVKTSVWDLVRPSVGVSIEASVRGSIWAYISSLFPAITTWKYIAHDEGVNPFQPAIDLWKQGLVPSFDGKMWRLHGGEEAKILYEMEVD